MYREYPSVFDAPPDEDKLWRYMNLERFIWMLKERKLYFSRVAQFSGDPYEGTAPRKLIEAVNARPDGQAEKLGYGIAGKFAAISCWHRNEYESVAMWKLYTSSPDGIAIQTTVSKLKRIDERADYVIGRVRYLDFEREEPPEVPPGYQYLRPWALLFQKRRSYAHEQEVRAVITPTDLPYERQIPHERVSWRTGFGVSADLPSLIERIVASPEYPSWAIAALQQVVRESGLTIQIEESDLLKPPNRECEEALQELLRSMKAGTKAPSS